MPRQPEDWDPNDDKLPEIMQKLHRHLDDAGAAEARAVHGLLFEILEHDLTAEEYLASLDELTGWAEAAKKAIAPARRRTRVIGSWKHGKFTRQIVRASTAMLAYEGGWLASSEKETHMADLLADLMHLAKSEGLDFSEILDKATRYHVGDSEGEGE
jgi:hypothetical protein